MKAVFTTCIFIVALFAASRALKSATEREIITPNAAVASVFSQDTNSLQSSSAASSAQFSTSAFKSESKGNWIQTDKITAHPTCLYSNPYLEHLRVKVNKYPNPNLDKTAGKCSGEWDIYGTCCPVNEAIAHATLDKATIEAAVESVKKRLPQLRQSLSELRDFLLHEHFMPNSSVSAIGLAKKAVQELFDQEQFEDYFETLVSMSDADLQQFNTALTTCWQEMISSRASAVCSSCSGRSSLFFKNSKGLISQEFCTSIMGHCASTLPTLLEIVIGLYKAEPLLRKLEEDGRFGLRTSIGTGIKFNKVQNYYSQLLKKNQIENYLDNYNNTNSTIKVNSLKMLCYHFLHISRPTIIEYISNIFATDIHSQLTVLPDIQLFVAQNKQQIDEVLTDYKKKQPKPKKGKIITGSKPQKKKRRLSALPSAHFQQEKQEDSESELEEEMLEGDIYMISQDVEHFSITSIIDSSYTSYVGTNGTSNHGGRTALPLNLTRVFP
jgi:hypothetical protein